MSVQPWYQLCTLRDDVRTGKLTLGEFDVTLNVGPDSDPSGF